MGENINNDKDLACIGGQEKVQRFKGEGHWSKKQVICGKNAGILNNRDSVFVKALGPDCLNSIQKCGGLDTITDFGFVSRKCLSVERIHANLKAVTHGATCLNLYEHIWRNRIHFNRHTSCKIVTKNEKMSKIMKKFWEKCFLKSKSAEKIIKDKCKDHIESCSNKGQNCQAVFTVCPKSELFQHSYIITQQIKLCVKLYSKLLVLPQTNAPQFAAICSESSPDNIVGNALDKIHTNVNCLSEIDKCAADRYTIYCKDIKKKCLSMQGFREACNEIVVVPEVEKQAIIQNQDKMTVCKALYGKMVHNLTPLYAATFKNVCEDENFSTGLNHQTKCQDAINECANLADIYEVLDDSSCIDIQEFCENTVTVALKSDKKKISIRLDGMDSELEAEMNFTSLKK